MKTKCYSVRLASLYRISEKAYKAIAFDGSSAILPASQVFGEDTDVTKSEAYWIAAWILPKKGLQFSNKKEAWFDENQNIISKWEVKRHIPDKCNPISDNSINELKKES